MSKRWYVALVTPLPAHENDPAKHIASARYWCWTKVGAQRKAFRFNNPWAGHDPHSGEWQVFRARDGDKLLPVAEHR